MTYWRSWLAASSNFSVSVYLLSREKINEFEKKNVETNPDLSGREQILIGRWGWLLDFCAKIQKSRDERFNRFAAALCAKFVLKIWQLVKLAVWRKSDWPSAPSLQRHWVTPWRHLYSMTSFMRHQINADSFKMSHFPQGKKK